MSKSDQWVNLLIIIFIMSYVLTLVIGYLTHRFASLAAIINISTGATVIIYWVVRQLQVQQHYFDNREILLLFFEGAVIVFGAIYIFSVQKNEGLKVMQSIFFGIHFLVLILGLVFMLTFKMTKLF